MKKLFEPIYLGRVRIKNRIAMAPMETNLSDLNGAPTDRLIRYFEERARGGVGLVIVGNAYIDSGGSRIFPNQLGAYSDLLLPKLGRLAEAVQAKGAKIFLQLNHRGGKFLPNFLGNELVAPSSIPTKERNLITKELTEEQIEDIVLSFAEAARRAQMAGFNGVELHGAHGYLIAQFMSPATNRRKDKYGGSLKNRMAFPLQVLHSVRRKVGSYFPIGFRISGDEYIENGIKPRTARIIAKKLDSSGVEYIHVSAGSGQAGVLKSSSYPMYLPRGYLIPLAAALKKEVNVPVITVGAIIGPDQAENVIAKRKADMVALGRALLADPYWPQKVNEGRGEEILTCIRCNYCTWLNTQCRELRCALNPMLGWEGDYRLTKTGKCRSVLIVGGGPAGMEAARVAALRGHKVILCEKERWLGGNLVPASKPDFKDELKNLLQYFKIKLKNLEVEIRLGFEVKPDNIMEFNPEVLIIATGSKLKIPEVPGIDIEIVVRSDDLLLDRKQVGDSVIVVGGGLIGCEVAAYLAEMDKEVTIVEMLSNIASDEFEANRPYLLHLLEDGDVSILTESRLVEVVSRGAIVLDKNRKRRTLQADTVVLATGLESERKLLAALEGEVQEIYAIGDCVEPRKIYEAIHEGFHVGRAI